MQHMRLFHHVGACACVVVVVIFFWICRSSPLCYHICHSFENAAEVLDECAGHRVGNCYVRLCLYSLPVRS